MHGRWIIHLIVLSTTYAAPQGQPEPYSIKLDKLGENLSQWLANNPDFDYCDNNTVDNRPGSAIDTDVVYCFPRIHDDKRLTYGSAPLLTETVWFYKRSLYKLEMTLRSRFGLADAMPALEAKFGEPSGREVTWMQNGFGAKFERSRWTWTNKLSTVELVYSDAPDDYPTITVTLDAANKEVSDRIKRAEQTRARSDM